MGRSITRSVHVLTAATAALREGKLDHRIAIEGEDELWRVAGSFNAMAEGLERMRAMELTNERLEEELRVARRIQERLLPEAPPILDRLELAGLSLPARHVGGDYFDYIPIDGGRRVAVAVADVSGKGVGAALLMSSFRASLRSQDLDRIGPGHASAILNRFVCGSVDPGKFITAFLAILDPATGEIRYVNAGHEPPILLRPDGGIAELDRGGLIMGAFAQAEYEEGTMEMPPGSLLAIFTDGVTEARNAQGGFLGDEPLRSILRSSGDASCALLLQSVVSAITAFAGDEPQSDDITLLLARRR
jgi:sigma-B regulation protein RsbU (phosphoserine phosphatase)